MKVQLEKSFPLAAAPEAAWALLQDLEAVAGCMPGARITERLGDGRYKGIVTVKLGPASLSFRGEVEVKDLEPDRRALRIVARGTDNTGTSGAAMDLHARIEDAEAGTCRLLGTSEVSISGKAATFGGRLMQGVADLVLQQFAANFAARLPPAGPPAARATATATAVASEPAVQPAPARPLNAVAVAWGMLRNWFHQLFAARRA
jgi:carbon monoxide dehydrogenase subunit G